LTTTPQQPPVLFLILY